MGALGWLWDCSAVPMATGCWLLFDGEPWAPQGWLLELAMGLPSSPNGYWLLAMGLLGSPNGFWNWLLELTSGTDF
jgi:hypothetical protein